MIRKGQLVELSADGDRQPAPDSMAAASRQETYIKAEPTSPPPFANVPDYPSNGRPLVQYRPTEIDLSTPTHTYQPQPRHEPPRSGLRYEYLEPSAPTAVRVASPAYQRPAQRNPQDLRRVASLHHAQRAASPPRIGAYSPVGPYQKRTVSMTYGDPRPQGRRREEDSDQPSYREPPSPESPQYPRSERSRSPPRFPEYQDPYAEQPTRVEMMPPPAAALRRIIVDQYGNRYMEAGPAPGATPSYVPRASVAPVETRAQPEMAYERVPSRASGTYVSSHQPLTQYEAMESRMPPPPLSTSRRPPPQEQQYDYVDANGTSIREYTRRPEISSPRYAPEPSSPVYQPARTYERMPPPPPPAPVARESAAPTFVHRSYSVLPEAPPSFVRQGSIAPVQYVRDDAPAAVRAASVAPAYRQVPLQPQQRVRSQAPLREVQQPQQQQSQQQSVRYVDQYGNEVFPRQLNEVRY